MSLKAKLEAVIYAAEEPVTLAQLAFLFSAEAMQWKAEQEAAAAAQPSETAGSEAPSVEPLPLLDDVFSYLELDAAPGATANPEQQATAPSESAAETAAGADSEAAAELASAPNPESGEATAAEQNSTEPAGAAADPEAEAKRQARQRDREIKAILRHLLDELVAEYAADGRGIEIREIAGGYRMATKPEYHDAVRGFVKSLKPALKLSLPALETLAVIAYKQPVTAPEVNEIRGVDSSGVFGSLLSRKLIATAGRKQVIGRPILYKTTKEFLLRFGLKDVSELPSMEEFEKMAAMELAEPEAADNEEASGEEASGEEASAESATESVPELDEAASEDPSDEPAARVEPSNQQEPVSAASEPSAQHSAEPAETEHSAP